MAAEIDAANTLLSSADEPRDPDNKITCDCEFFRKYQLPCRDIWVQHILFNTLRAEHFERWAFMWEDSGFELYKGITSEYYTKEIDGEIGAPYRRRLNMREALDSLKSKYYNLEEAVAELLQGLADNALKGLVARLEYITGPLRNMGKADLKAELQAEYGVVVDARNPLGGSLYY